MSRSIRTTLAAALSVIALLGATGGAPQTPPQTPPPGQQSADQTQPQPPIFRTGINFVRVDVIVSDKQGNAVADLQPGDFDVTEDGKPQKIETFKLIKLDGGAVEASKEPPKQIRTDYDEESESARDDVRLFAIFLDDYHVRLGSSLSVRAPIQRFLETQIGPTDMVGVMYPLQPVSSIRFTRNHDAVIKAMEQFKGRKFDYTPKNDFEEQYANYPAEVVERIRTEVSLSALKALITHMGSLKEGRKSLILVSEGYSYALPPQLRNPIATMPGLGNPNARNPMAGMNDPNEDRYQFFSGLDLQTDLREVYDAANRNNTAIYGVDPRGLATGEFDIADNVNISTDQQYLTATMDTIRVLSDNSDGRAIVNRNDLATGMKQIVRDASAYYLVGYNSSQAPSDGKFHEIKVRVKRSGVQVRSRKGYWALTAEETRNALTPKKPGPPKAVENALASIEQPKRARVIRTWIGTARGDDGKTKVTFVWEPTARTAGDRPQAAEQPARVSLMAVGQDGSPYFRGRVPDVALASTTPPTGTPVTAAAKGPSRVTFEVPPGKMQLRISVEGSASQVLDSETRDLTVPDLTAHVSLGTPEVLRARTAREYQQVKTDPDAVPVATREFSRTDRLVVRVPAYGPAGTAPQVTAKLLNRTGKPMSDLPVSAAGTSSFTIDLPLAGLAVGDYLVEVHAAGEGAESKELVGFRVTG